MYTSKRSTWHKVLIVVATSLVQQSSALGQAQIINNCGYNVFCAVVMAGGGYPNYVPVVPGEPFIEPFENAASAQGVNIMCLKDPSTNLPSGLEYSWTESSGQTHFDLTNIDAGAFPPFLAEGMKLETSGEGISTIYPDCRGAQCLPGESPCGGIYLVGGDRDAPVAERTCSNEVTLVWTLCSGPPAT